MTFVNVTTPIIKHFEGLQGQNLVKTISGEKDVNEVWAEVEKLF